MSFRSIRSLSTALFSSIREFCRAILFFISSISFGVNDADANDRALVIIILGLPPFPIVAAAEGGLIASFILSNTSDFEAVRLCPRKVVAAAAVAGCEANGRHPRSTAEIETNRSRRRPYAAAAPVRQEGRRVNRKAAAAAAAADAAAADAAAADAING